jgi:hypothetical protein
VVEYTFSTHEALGSALNKKSNLLKLITFTGMYYISIKLFFLKEGEDPLKY